MLYKQKTDHDALPFLRSSFT